VSFKPYVILLSQTLEIAKKILKIEAQKLKSSRNTLSTPFARMSRIIRMCYYVKFWGLKLTYHEKIRNWFSKIFFADQDEHDGHVDQVDVVGESSKGFECFPTQKLVDPSFGQIENQ